MPWINRNNMSTKEEFILKALSNEYNINKLCNEYNISRKTAYKWINRFKKDGIEGLNEKSRRPTISPTLTSENNVNLILELRDKYPEWGARKLRHVLMRESKIELPCESTFNRILKQYDKIDPIQSEKRKHFIRFERELPNQLWQMDFKGHFKLLELGRCHPLTILDDHSRFSISLKAFNSENGESVKKALEEAFRKYGLPDAMTMDNGSPWKGSPPFRLSKITVWLTRLGIKVSHSTPRHPQTQGKEERFHRTLKTELLKYYQFKDLSDAQLHFDEWREVYNNIRPHEGIGMLCPANRYVESSKRFPEILMPVEYPERDEVRRVGKRGTIDFKGTTHYIGEHLHEENVGIREVKEDTYDVYFCTTKVKRFNLRKNEM